MRRRAAYISAAKHGNKSEVDTLGGGGRDLGAGLLGDGSSFDGGAIDNGVGLLGGGAGLLGGGPFPPTPLNIGDIFAGSGAAGPFVPSAASMPSMAARAPP
jgi:hypothetical protein